MKQCGIEHFAVELSVRSKAKKAKYLGSDDDWDFAEQMLKKSLDELNILFKVMKGEAKFYGPAIDLKVNDAAGKSWQCSSIQMDFNLGNRFNLQYFDKNGHKQVPYILHRCIFGSLERFMGLLLEHHKGDLPLWLAPVQVRIVSIDEIAAPYAKFLSLWMEKNFIRYEVDLSNNNLSAKIKHAQLESIPIVVIVGKKEMERGKISVRSKIGDKKNGINKEELLNMLR